MINAKAIMSIGAIALVTLFSMQSARADSWKIPVFKTYAAGSTVSLSDLVLKHTGQRHLRRYQLQNVVLQVKIEPAKREGRIALVNNGQQSAARTVSGFHGKTEFSAREPHTFERLILHAVQDKRKAQNSRQARKRRQEWALYVGDLPVHIGAIVINASKFVAKDWCLEHSHRSPSAGVITQGPKCAAEGTPITISLGDDTGYRDQKLRITSKRGETCMSHSRQAARAQVIDSGWVCSSAGTPSAWIALGDDTGFKEQRLRIVSTNRRQQLCLRFNNGHGWSNKVCSKDDVPSKYLGIGDDTGYRTQTLELSVSR